MNNNGHGFLKVPGFNGISIYKSLDPNKTFDGGANGWTGWIQDPRLTVRELAMVQFIASLTDTNQWDKCVFKEEIVAVWRENALKIPLISLKAWEWCLAEIRDKAVVFNETRRVLNLDTGSCVCKYDEVPSALRDQLLKGITTEYAHPHCVYEKQGIANKYNQIFNIVDPSMFPLVYGRTEVLVNKGTVDLNLCFESYRNGTVALSHPEQRLTPTMIERKLRGRSPFNIGYNRDQTDLYRWSTRFQWLPCEVSFKEPSTSETIVRITSYINNIHPTRSRSLYHSIESLISLAIKPWNDCLLFGKKNGRVPMRIRTYGAGPGFGKPWHTCSNILMCCECPIHPEPGTAFSYVDWKKGLTGEAIVNKTNHGMPERVGEIRADSNHTYYQVALQDTFREQGLQVIVKISSIELDPIQPNYKGSDWILEGQLNEHIVATAAYYYEVENVTPTVLSFRQETTMNPEEYEFRSYDTENLEAVFGVSDDVDLRTDEDCMHAPPTQDVGSVTTPQGRLLAWPNALQHRLEPFELLDKTRPGRRSCIVLYLVDPHYRICSTRNVPPQQHDWWAEAALAKTNLPPESAARNFPQEVKNLILKKTEDWPMGVAEATQICAEVEKDRAQAFEAIMARMSSFNFYDEAWA